MSLEELTASPVAYLTLCYREPARPVQIVDNTDPVERALQFIREHFNDSGLTLTMVARHAAQSQYQLTRNIAARTGLRFKEHLHRERIIAAQRLLLTTDYSVKQVAALVGYSDATQLGKRFKRSIGVSPRVYKRRDGLLAHLTRKTTI